MTSYDYEFDLGEGRHLKGRGHRGLIALMLLFAFLFAIVWTVENTSASGRGCDHTACRLPSANDVHDISLRIGARAVPAQMVPYPR